MPTFLYNLPDGLLGLLVSGVSVTLSLAGYALFRRCVRREFTADERGLAVSALGVVATITSLLLAFSAVSVWEAFTDAEQSALSEGDVVGQLARDLAVFGSPESREARELLRRYAEVVTAKEWEDMRSGTFSREAWQIADEVFRVVGTLEPDTLRRQALLPEIWSKLNDLVEYRRDRLYASRSEVPTTLWAAVLMGSALTVLTMFVLPPTRFTLAVIGSIALALGLVFSFIIAMDHPFAGGESVTPMPFQSAIESMRQWDAAEAARPRGGK